MKNNEKFEFYLEKLEIKYPNTNHLNKKQMLEVINMSTSTHDRRIEQNDLFSIPEPSYTKSIKRKGKPYKTYKFDKYELAMFMTDSNIYDEEIRRGTKLCN